MSDLNAVPEVSGDDNLDPEVETLDPVLAEYQTEDQQETWIKELTSARDERRKFDGVAVKTIQRYADQRTDEVNSRQNRYNLFYANTEIKLSALYSHTPEADVRRRFMDANDPVSRVAATLAQRATFIEMELDNFDQKFRQMLFDFLVPGMGIGWVRIEQETGEGDQTVITDPTTGEQHTVSAEEPNIIEQMTHIDYVAWDDFIYAPCSVWTDCRWIGRRVPMNKNALQARFGTSAPAGVLDEVTFEKNKSAEINPSDKLKSKNNTQKTADIFEIWDRECRCIFWICESASVPLDVKPDTNEFQDFFPTPLPPLGRFTTASTIPRSDFTLAQDLYDMLDDLQARAANLIECIKVKFVYDASRPELANIFTTLGENKGIGVADWQMWQSDKGGLQNAIQFVPLESFTTSLQITLGNIQKVKQDIFDIEGIADFMRGQTQAYDSAAAISQKGTFAGNRLGTVQKQIAQYIEKLVRLKLHLMTKFYQPEIFIDRAGALPADDQQYLGQAVQLLQTNFASNFRLSISVDSIQDANWNAEKTDRTTLVHTIGEMIGQVMPMVQQNPDLGPLAVELIKFAVAGYKGASSIEGVLDAGLQKMLADALQSKGAPPPPNPEQIKAQSEAAKSQADLQIVSMQEETKRMAAQMAVQQQAVEQQMSHMKLQLDAFKAMHGAHAAAVNGAHSIGMDHSGMGV